MASPDTSSEDQSLFPVQDPYNLYHLERSAVFAILLSDTPYYPPKVHAQLAVCVLLKTPVIILESVAPWNDVHRALLPEMASANVVCITSDKDEAARVSGAIANDRGAPVLGNYQPPQGIGPWKLINAHRVVFLYCQACGRARFRAREWLNPTYHVVVGTHQYLCTHCVSSHAVLAHVCDPELRGDYGSKGLTLPEMSHVMYEIEDEPTMPVSSIREENKHSPPHHHPSSSWCGDE